MSNAAPKRQQLQLPTGGVLRALADLPGQSSECTAAANLQTQAAPLLALLGCEFAILKLLKPLIDIVRGLPAPPARALQDFTGAALELQPYLLASTPLGVLPFAKDLLCLEVRSLTCFLRNLQSITAAVEANPNGIPQQQIQDVLDTYPPIAGILELAAGIFAAAGLTFAPAPQLPAATDVASLKACQQVIAGFTSSLQVIADSLGGCA